MQYEDGQVGDGTFDPNEIPNALIDAVEQLTKEKIYRSLLIDAVTVQNSGKDLIAPNSPMAVIYEIKQYGEIELSGTQYEGRNDRIENAEAQAMKYGEVGRKIIESPAFFKQGWLLKKYTVKKYQDEINEIIQQAVTDVNTIQATDNDNTPILMARFYETLSMSGVKSFLESLNAEHDADGSVSIQSEDHVLGYKVLKITATQIQMASILNQLELMGLEVEELEDGMPQPMIELQAPNFDSFVAFDIETTGTFGAAKGDTAAQITEIGAIKVEDGKIVDKFSMLANPGRKIVPSVARLTHITDDMVKDEPPVDEVICLFKEFIGDSVLVGHNIKNCDIPFISAAAKHAGVAIENPFFDTYRFAKTMRGTYGWDNVKLEYLSEQFGISQPDAHRAWCDAEANVGVFFKLKELVYAKV